MEHLMLWNPEDWTDRETYEAMIDAVGGSDLDRALSAARDARHTLEASLSPEQRDAYLEASDAGVDATTHRETVVTRIALAHGVAIGAALAAFPEEDPLPLIRAAARVASGALAGDLPPSVALQVQREVLGALDRAEQVAALPRWTGGHGLRVVPVRERPRPQEVIPAEPAEE